MNTRTIDARIAELEDKVRRPVEVLLNKPERTRLDELRGGLGRSPYFRALLDEADRRHRMPPPGSRESRGCPGIGRVASRGRVAGQRRPF